MKHIITLILVAAMLLSLPACGTTADPVSMPLPTGGEPAEETAYPTETASTEHREDRFYTVDYGSNCASMNYQPIFETDDSIYYLAKTWKTFRCMIYVSAKEYHDWMPLCSRPDCMHTDDNCSAWLEGDPQSSMWLYGDHIYYLTDTSIGMDYTTEEDEFPELWRMRLDGSKHEKLMKADLSEAMSELWTMGGGISYSCSWFFHNRFAVISFLGDGGLSNSGEGGLPSESMIRHTYVIDLSAEKPEMRELELRDENGEPSQIFAQLAGIGDKLYHVQRVTKKLYETDLVSGEQRLLAELPFEPAGFGECAYADGKLYFCNGYDEGLIIHVDVDTGEITTVNEAEPQEWMWYDVYGDHIFGSSDPYEQEIAPEILEMWREAGFEYVGKKDPERLFCTEVYDLTGGLIQHIPHEAYEDKYIHIGWIIGDYVLGYECPDGVLNTDKTPEWYLDLRELGTEEFFWRRWEP